MVSKLEFRKMVLKAIGERKKKEFKRQQQIERDYEMDKKKRRKAR